MTNTIDVPRYSYLTDPHDVFRLPPRSTPIWRYMTLPALLMVLDSRKLFFRRASKFDDRFEGAIPRRAEEKLRAWQAQHMGPEAIQKYRDERAKSRERVVINCWHMSTHESSAMWSQYGKTEESVAIRSTVERLIMALPRRRDGEEKPGWEALFVGQVEYIDYAIAEFPPHNLYYPYVHKREDYEHEKEVRAMTMISDAVQAAADADAPAEFEVTDLGLLLPVDLDKLVESVHISPLAGPWFASIVHASLERFGFDSSRVKKSAMAEEPIY